MVYSSVFLRRAQLKHGPWNSLEAAKMTVTATVATLKPLAVIVQQGKVLDFIDGRTQREETPEEYVRQEIAKSLVREYGYPKRDIAVEFVLRLGSKKPRADLVVFNDGEDHDQANA